MNTQKMIEWIGTHNVGISSRTMWCGLMGVNPGSDGRFDVPHDADDFSPAHGKNRIVFLKRQLPGAEIGKIPAQDPCLVVRQGDGRDGMCGPAGQSIYETAVGRWVDPGLDPVVIIFGMDRLGRVEGT